MAKKSKEAIGSSSSSSVAPFLKKCYEMVDDSSTDSIISWSINGDNNSFVISDTTVFSVQLLPKYFKHSNLSSFIRQLNIYGFRKVDADRWEFANDGFVKGRKDLLKNVVRRKNIQASSDHHLSKTVNKQESTRDASPSHEETEKSELWKEVDILKGDKNALAQELIKVRQYQETTDTKMLNLEDRVQGMEESQQEMLSFLVMVMQNPSLLVQLLQPKEKAWRNNEGGGATILEEVTDEGEANSTGLPLVTYQQQPSLDGTAKSKESDLNDFLRNADMLKFCLDENHVPLIIPDLYDDGAWEKLLLLSPSKKKKRNNNVKKGKDDATLLEHEEEDDGAMELDKNRTLELILEEMEKPDDDFEFGQLTPEKSRNLEILTKQMRLLASNE